MPPRGQHGYEHTDATTNTKTGKYDPYKQYRGKGVQEAPGSTGFGLTPENVAGYYAKPENANSQFAQTARDNAANFQAGAAANAETIRKAWEDKSKWLLAAAGANAQAVSKRAQALAAAANGKLKDNGVGRNAADFLGFDLKSKAGRQAAAEYALRSQQLADKAGSGEVKDAYILDEFNKQYHQFGKRSAHARMVQEQADAKAQIDEQSNYDYYKTHPWDFVGDATGISSTGHDAGAAFKHDLGTFVGAAGKVVENIPIVNSGFSAYEYSKLHGGDELDQITAFLGGVGNATSKVVGGSGLNAKSSGADAFGLSHEAQQAIVRTGDSKRKEELTKSGDLVSFGQYYLHQWDSLNPKALKYAQANDWVRFMPKNSQLTTHAALNALNELANYHSGGKNGTDYNLLSGALDAAWQYYADPFTIAGKGIEAAGFAGELGARQVRVALEEEARLAGGQLAEEGIQAATKAARGRFVLEHPVGVASVEETARAVIEKAPGNVERILNILGRKASDRQFAAKLAEATVHGDEAAVRQTIIDGFIEGAWRPHKSLTGRVLARMGYIGSPGPKFVPQLVDVLRNAHAGNLAKDLVDPTTGEIIQRAGTRFFNTLVEQSDPIQALFHTVSRVVAHTKTLGGAIREAAVESAARAPAQRLRELVDRAVVIDLPGFKVITEDIARRWFGTGRSFVEFTVAERDQFLRELDYADSVRFILDGGAGEEARNIAVNQLTKGFKPVGIVEDLTNMSQGLKSAWGFDWIAPTAKARSVLKSLDGEQVRHLLENAGQSDPDVRHWFVDKLMQAEQGSNEWTDLLQGLVAAEADGTGNVGRQILRAAELGTHLEAVRAAANEIAIKYPRKWIQTLSHLVPSMVDKASLTVLRTFSSQFVGQNQEVVADFFIRFGQALHFSKEELGQLATLAEEVGSHIARGGDPREAEALLKRLVVVPFTKLGLSKEDADAWVAAHTDDFFKTNTAERTRAYAAVVKDGTDPLSDMTPDDYELWTRGALVGSQVQTTFTAPEVQQILRGANKALFGSYAKEHGLALTIGSHLGITGEIVIDKAGKVGVKMFGKTRTLKGGIHAVLSLWKVSVTTHLFLPLVAVPAIGLTTGDWGDAFTFGGVAAGAGLVRYASRMSIQNRIDGVLYHGLSPRENVPVLSRFFRNNARKGYGHGGNGLLVNSEASPWEARIGNWFKGKDSEWRTVVPKGATETKNFIEGYHRVLNFQLQPEEDEVVRILLNERAGTLTREEADKELETFFAGADGPLWRQKNHVAPNASIKAATGKPRKFIDAVLPPKPNAWGEDGFSQAARARLEAYGPGKEVSQGDIRDLLHDGHLADAIHFQDSSTIVNHPRELWNKFKTQYDAIAYGSSKNIGYKEGFFAVERERQLKSLNAAGITGKRAEDIAGNIALRHTNDIMFRYDNVSRFAHAVDWIAPFTGHRMFNAVSWTKAIVANPGRTLRFAELGARAFNTAADAHIFYKNHNGDWSLTIPGQGALAQVLGKDNLDQYVTLGGFLAMTGELDRSVSAGNPLAGAAEVVAPHPGGPWWTTATRVIREVAPELAGDKSPLPHGVRSFLWPFGPETSFVPSVDGKYLRLIVGDGGIWNLIDDGQAEEELHRMEIARFNDLVTQHLLAHPLDVEWVPSDDEVKRSVVGVMEMQQLFQSISPASPHPRFQTKEKFTELWTAWTARYGGKVLTGAEFSAERKAFLDAHPAYYAYLQGTSEWKDGDFKDWAHSSDTAKSLEASFANINAKEFARQRKSKTLSEYRSTILTLRKREAGQRAWKNANSEPNPENRLKALDAVDKAYPEQAKYFRTAAHAENALAHILNSGGSEAAKQESIDHWRHTFAPDGSASVSRNEFNRMKAKIIHYQRHLGTDYTSSPQSLARPGHTVWKEVSHSFQGALVLRDGTLNNGMVAAIQQLPPAEQVLAFKEAILRLDSDVNFQQGDPTRYNFAYEALRKGLRYTYAANQQLFSRPSDRVATDHDIYKAELQRQSTEQFTTLQAMFDESSKLSAEASRLYDAKQGAAAHAVSVKAKELKARIVQTQNEFLWKNRAQDSVEMHDAVREFAFINSLPGHHESANQQFAARVRQLQKGGYVHAPTFEEAHFLAMPENTRATFKDQLAIALNEDPALGSETFAINAENAWARNAEGIGGGKITVPFHLYWDRLTQFQRELMEKTAPKEMVDGWKAVNADATEKMIKDAKKGGGKGGRGRGGGGRFTVEQSEINYAFAMMKKYSKRAGMAKPAGYAEYLTLPQNPAVRAQFLEKHPEVADYIKAGPMANMPPTLQMIVQDIMIRNGKWDGEAKTIGEITDIGFAREQLQRYNKRTGPAPTTYDAWLNMPSGQAKADYLTQHPEIKQWLQLGPMANMPEIYRDVVRDIMYRYHEWTASTDGMGEVLSGYFRTPSYARKDFLAAHPELSAYWAATRSPQDEAIGQQVDAYYAAQDPAAKASMLSANPQLKQYFLDSRTRRYERFLNQVAQFMGQNPELFKKYLDDQQRVLGDLLNKFAEPSLAKETHWMTPTKVKTKSTEGTRTRG